MRQKKEHGMHGLNPRQVDQDIRRLGKMRDVRRCLHFEQQLQCFRIRGIILDKKHMVLCHLPLPEEEIVCPPASSYEVRRERKASALLRHAMLEVL